MTPYHYRFRNVWTIRASADEVLKALVDVESYPAWWRDIRAVRRLDEDSGLVQCRAVLPFALDLRLRRAEEDFGTGRLRIDIAGDLEGYCGARVEAHGSWSIVQISQDVRLVKPRLRRVEPVIRPIMRANHGAMMWRGQRGLRGYLDGGR